MEWPIYPLEHSKKLVVGNISSNIGICTLWTPVEKVVSEIDKDNYAVAGQLVTKSQGLSAIIRNCLLHGAITDIVVFGNNKTGTLEALKCLIENGVDENYNIIGTINAEIEPEIPISAIELFRNNIKLHFPEKLENSFLINLKKEKRYSEQGKLIFPDHKIEIPRTFPWEGRVYVIREPTVGKAWQELLFAIRRFGELKETRHGEQQEIQQMVIEITEEDPFNPLLESYFPFTKEDLDKYFPEVLTGQTSQDLHYTYGSRIFSFDSINPELIKRLENLQVNETNSEEIKNLAEELKTYNQIDQIKNVIANIKSDKYARFALVSLWNQHDDGIGKAQPCIDLLQFIVQKEKLNLFVWIRSNDMVKAWPMNAFALRKMQGNVAKELGLEIGSLITNSISGHLYTADSDIVERVIKTRKTDILKPDPRGNLVISVSENKVIVTHFNPDGKEIGKYEAEGVAKLELDLVKDNVISSISHALDIGAEIQKAFISIKLNKPYIQDLPLEL